MKSANKKNCEDVSSDDCFEENLTATAPSTSENTKSSLNTMPHDLQDLVEDVSSNSDIESGELSS